MNLKDIPQKDLDQALIKSCSYKDEAIELTISISEEDHNFSIPIYDLGKYSVVEVVEETTDIKDMIKECIDNDMLDEAKFLIKKYMLKEGVPASKKLYDATKTIDWTGYDDKDKDILEDLVFNNKELLKAFEWHLDKLKKNIRKTLNLAKKGYNYFKDHLVNITGIKGI
jgi:hypothetical protein